MATKAVKKAMRWFEDQFGGKIDAAVNNTPFSSARIEFNLT
jgi:hypothetical protein